MKSRAGAYLEQAIVKWQGLQKREQRIIVGGLALITLAVCYYVFFQPAWTGRKSMRVELPVVRTQIAKIESMANEVKTLSDVRITGMSRASVRAELQRLLDVAGLSSQAKLDAGGDVIKVKFDAVEFDSMMGWLYQVVRDVKLRVVDVSINRDTSPGRVAASVSLERPSGKEQG